MRTIRVWFVVGSVSLLLSSTMTAHGQEMLDWQDRGDRYEGVVGRLKAAQIELLSAAVLYREEPAEEDVSPPSRAQLQFYLAEDESVFVSVREFKRHHYWMQPKHRDDWGEGKWCFFSWPMEDVLEKLTPAPATYELGATARIGSEYSHRLAPIVLYQRKPPSEVTAYRFIFRPPDNGDILELRWAWYRLGEDPPLMIDEGQSLTERQHGGKPFSIDWECTHNGEAWPEGWYLLYVKGRLEYPNRDATLDKRYQLYHRPLVR